jgi:hypothetical protein
MAMKDVSLLLAHGAWASSWAWVITALKADAVKGARFGRTVQVGFWLPRTIE